MFPDLIRKVVGGELEAEVDLGGGELENEDDLDSGEPGGEVEMGGADLLSLSLVDVSGSDGRRRRT